MGQPRIPAPAFRGPGTAPGALAAAAPRRPATSVLGPHGAAAHRLSGLLGPPGLVPPSPPPAGVWQVPGAQAARQLENAGRGTPALHRTRRGQALARGPQVRPARERRPALWPKFSWPT